MPTLKEFGKSLGLSKSRQESLIGLVQRDSVTGQPVKVRPHASTGSTLNQKRKTASRSKK